MKQRIVTFIAVPLVALSSALAQETNPPHNYKPSQGYVPNAETAIRIALAVWEPIYGKKQIDSEKPYRATLRDGVWTVEGSLPPGWRGGVAIPKYRRVTERSCELAMAGRRHSTLSCVTSSGSTSNNRWNGP